ncbi:hypothetical protein GGF31_004760 [Allomyces arbusculus]|nr:hypothetical protein GGF31_004760 [Allomyces arbusculus]
MSAPGPHVTIYGPAVVHDLATTAPGTVSLVGQTLLEALVDLSRQYTPAGLALIRSLMPLSDELAARIRHAGVMSLLPTM